MYSYSNNIAVIGAGYWGKNLIRVFAGLGALRTICDSNRKILSQRKKEYPLLEITPDFAKILKDKKIKGLVIATPVATHYQLARKGLNAGKDVFIEKPMTLKAKESEELVKLAQKKRKILMVGHLLIYHPAVVELKSLIKKKALGDIQYVLSNRLNFGKLRKEENILWSFASHDISIVLEFFGLPKNVKAVGKSYLQKNIPDIALVVFEFKKNKAAHIFVSWLNPFKEQKLSVIGSKKMAVFDGVKNELIIFPYRVEFKKNMNPLAIKADGEIVKVPKKEPLAEEAKHFLDCVAKRRKPLTDGMKGLEVLKVLDACQKSMESQGKAINLN